MLRDVSSQMWHLLQWQKLVLEGIFFKSYHKFIEFNLFFIHLILFWIDELIYLYSIYLSNMNIESIHDMEITDDIFKSIFNESVWISITISLKFVPKDPIDHKSALDQVMAWHRTGEKPLPESIADQIHRRIYTALVGNKQRFLTPGHQGWNDLHGLCRIGMEYYLLNNDDNNIIYWIMMIIMIMMMMIIIMIIMMTMMIIGTATIMIMIIIITTTLTMTITKMIMIKTAQTPCQSLYKDRRI